MPVPVESGSNFRDLDTTCVGRRRRLAQRLRHELCSGCLALPAQTAGTAIECSWVGISNSANSLDTYAVMATTLKALC
jgi:hypothetical protein